MVTPPPTQPHDGPGRESTGAEVFPGFDAFEDFAGPGGWDEGAKMLGLRLYGVDYDGPACETARAAGHHREQADVTEHVSPAWARGKGHVSSPSCTLFSMAGSGVGRLVLDVLADGIRRILHAEHPAVVRAETRAAIYPVAHAEVAAKNAKRKAEKRWTDEKVEAKARLDAKVASLVLEPARRIMELDPEWVALEQVPEVLPLWQVYERELRAKGWSAWSGVLNSADYGVPQTRRRAILIGSRVRKVAPPEPTHAEDPQGDDLFGGVRAKWISMAEALGRGWEDAPSCTVSSGGAATDGAEPFANAGYRRRLGEYVTAQRRDSGPGAERDPRPVDQPSHTIRAAGSGTAPSGVEWVLHTNRDQRPDGSRQTIPGSEPAPKLTAKSGGQWKVQAHEVPPVYVNGNQPNAGRRSAHEPAPTVLFVHRSNDVRWVFERPATTVVGSFKPDVIAAPGYRTQESRQDAPGSVSVSVSEAGVLQSFRADYPWQGSKSKRYEQVGNAIPPLMAAHVLSAVTGIPLRSEVAA